MKEGLSKNGCVHKQLRNAATKKIKLAIKSYYQGLISEYQHNPKRMWQTINKVLDRSSKSAMNTSLTIEENKQGKRHKGGTKSPFSFSGAKTSGSIWGKFR